MYTRNEILFPYHLIPTLKNLRGPIWADLIKSVEKLPETHEKTIAFMVMMVRISNCMQCETDCYRAMKGCRYCTSQTLRRYKGTDSDLVQMYESALVDVRKFDQESEQKIKLMADKEEQFSN